MTTPHSPAPQRASGDNPYLRPVGLQNQPNPYLHGSQNSLAAPTSAMNDMRLSSNTQSVAPAQLQGIQQPQQSLQQPQQRPQQQSPVPYYNHPSTQAPSNYYQSQFNPYQQTQQPQQPYQGYQQSYQTPQQIPVYQQQQQQVPPSYHHHHHHHQQQQPVMAPMPQRAHHHQTVQSNQWTIQYKDLQLGKELGRGAFGVVYKGRWRFTDVAIKVCGGTPSAADLRTFQEETNLMMNLRPHRNVVQLRGVCHNPVCVVIDFVDGGALEAWLHDKNKPIGWSKIFQWASGICAGMLHIHLEGIIHRDLASRNVLLDGLSNALIADFGLSAKTFGTQNNAKQEVGFFRGPYKWMAPESLKFNQFSVKTDVWSYGVTLWEILSRRLPFEDKTIYQVKDEVVRVKLRLPMSPKWPETWRNLLVACFRTDPANRPDMATIGGWLDQMAKDYESKIAGGSDDLYAPDPSLTAEEAIVKKPEPVVRPDPAPATSQSMNSLPSSSASTSAAGTGATAAADLKKETTQSSPNLHVEQPHSSSTGSITTAPPISVTPPLETSSSVPGRAETPPPYKEGTMQQFRKMSSSSLIDQKQVLAGVQDNKNAAEALIQKFEEKDAKAQKEMAEFELLEEEKK